MADREHAAAEHDQHHQHHRHGAADPPRTPVRQIFVCVDGSAASHGVLQWALRNLVVTGAGTEVILAHCFPYPAPQLGSLAAHGPDALEPMHAVVHERAWLADLARSLHYSLQLPAGVAVTLLCEPAEHIADWIVRHAAALVPDAVVVIGATGKGMVQRMLVGSVGSKLAHTCPRPLAIVPPQPPTQPSAQPPAYPHKA